MCSTYLMATIFREIWLFYVNVNSLPFIWCPGQCYLFLSVSFVNSTLFFVIFWWLLQLFSSLQTHFLISPKHTHLPTRSYFYVKTRSTYYYYYNYYCSNYYYTTTPRLYPSKCLTTLIRTTLGGWPTVRPLLQLQLQPALLLPFSCKMVDCLRLNGSKHPVQCAFNWRGLK